MQLLGCKWYYVLWVICAALDAAAAAAAQAYGGSSTRQENILLGITYLGLLLALE